MSEEKLLTKLSDLQNIFRERDERSGRIVKRTSPTLPRGVVLPAGWESARSPSGRTYFFHRSSGRSQWNPPLTRESRTPVSRTTSRPPPPSRLGRIADAVLDRRSQNRDMNTKTMVVAKKTSTSPASTFPKPNVDIASSFFASSPSTTRSVGKYSNARRPAEEKKIKRTPREPPKLAVIYRRQSLKEQKEKMGKSGVVVEDDVSKEDFSEYSNDALEKEYRRQLETERRLLRKAAMLRKELQRPKNVFDGRNPFLSPKHGEESQEYIRSEASVARKRRVRIHEVLLERRGGGSSSSSSKVAEDRKVQQDNSSPSKTQTPVMKNKVQTKPELPQGWNMTIDPSTGRPYYYHAETGESTWNLPGADDDGKEDKALPAGWARSTTREGRKYYYNGTTGQVQWEFPIAHIATAEASAQDDDDPTGSTRKVRGVRARSARISIIFTFSCFNYITRISLTSITQEITRKSTR